MAEPAEDQRRDEDVDSGSKSKQERLIQRWVSRELERRAYGGAFPRKRNLTRRSLVIACLLVMIMFSTFPLVLPEVGVSGCSQSVAQQQRSTPPRGIALIDQLGSEYPNPDFANNIRSSATQEGYRLDYYSSDQVTVEMFTQLATKDYAMIVLRDHGGFGYAVITTSEPYSQYQHVGDQLNDRLVEVKVNSTSLFGLSANFVAHNICGKFPGTLVLWMGCSLKHPAVADAFLEKGARAFIGWDGSVTSYHDDIAFESLAIQLIQHHPVAPAVRDVSQIVGPDPLFGSELEAVPQNSAVTI